MRIEVVGRNVEVTPAQRELATDKFRKVARQVSELARLDLVVREETNPAIPEPFVIEATLQLKGRTLHADESATTVEGAIRGVAKDVRRQVKRHRERQRGRSRTRQLVGKMRRGEA